MKCHLIIILLFVSKFLYVVCSFKKVFPWSESHWVSQVATMLGGACTDTNSEGNTYVPQTFKITVDAEISLNAF